MPGRLSKPRLRGVAGIRHGDRPGGSRGGDPSAELALGRAAAGGAAVDGAMVTDAALDGDETARGVLALAGRRIGVALASPPTRSTPRRW